MIAFKPKPSPCASDDVNLYNIIQSHAKLTPYQVALIDQHSFLSYQQLGILIDNVICNLHKRRITLDSRFCLISPNALTLMTCTVAAARLGAVCFVAPKRIASQDLVEYLTANEIKFVISHSKADADTSLASVASIDAAALLMPRTQNVPAELAGDPMRLVRVCWTSGSTGKPKGIAWTEQATLDAVRHIAQFHPTKPSDRIHVSVGLDANFGFTQALRALVYGATLVIGRGGNRKDPDDIPRYVEQTQSTQWIAGPTALTYIIRRLRRDPASAQRFFHRVDRFIFGGAHIPAALRREFAEALGPRLFINYGTSEVGMIATSSPASLAQCSPDQCFYDMFTEAIVVDANENPVPTGTRGQLLVTKTATAAGYLSEGKLDRSQFAASRYLTGDFAVLHGEGMLELLGRKEDMLVFKEHTLNLLAIESIVASAPNVVDAIVFPLVDADQTPQHLAAIYVATQSVSAEDVQAFCKQYLAPKSMPGLFKQVTALPLAASGKKDRRSMTKRFKPRSSPP